MKKILSAILLIFSYNLFLLVLPLLIFLAGLSFSSDLFLDSFPWIYGPFLFLSPVLTIFLGFRIIRDQALGVIWFTPVIISFLGFAPFIILYFLLNSFWNLQEYLLLISFPVFLGLCSNLAGLIAHH